MFEIFHDIVRTVFAENCVAAVFIAALFLDLTMPKDKATKQEKHRSTR